jgi:hypothetical protein
VPITGTHQDIQSKAAGWQQTEDAGNLALVAFGRRLLGSVEFL